MPKLLFVLLMMLKKKPYIYILHIIIVIIILVVDDCCCGVDFLFGEITAPSKSSVRQYGPLFFTFRLTPIGLCVYGLVAFLFQKKEKDLVEEQNKRQQGSLQTIFQRILS